MDMVSLEEKKKAVIAVIGKSAAGKSAFIKSFCSKPELIDSEGRGQTTRTYLEYKFFISKDDRETKVSAKVLSKKDFSERRVEQIIVSLQNAEYNIKKDGMSALAERFNDSDFYKEEVKQYILHSKDFFDISEFEFIGIDLNIVIDKYNNVIECIEKYQDLKQNKIDNNYFNKLQDILQENIIENSEKGDYVLSELLKIFFEEIYDYIITCMKQYGPLESFLYDDGSYTYIKFNVAQETKDLLAVLLRVVSEGKKVKSITGILGGLKIESNICENYYEVIKKQGFEEIELIDTFGLDHSSPEDKDILIERYNRIFGKDYPNVNIVFFIEAFHTGASTEFSQAIRLLYSQRPDIMTYVIGTHIDENSITDEDENWLCKIEKESDGRPAFNGNVMDILYGTNIITTLMRSHVSESMAKMRCSVMQKRFAPFCGKLEMVNNTQRKNMFINMNDISIKSLFYSISREEHLGDKYVDINLLLSNIENIPWDNILKVFVCNITKNFKSIIEKTQTRSRTRGKIRKNLKNHILGFDGSTIDATWYRVFRDAYIQTFSMEIEVGSDKKFTLSKALGYEGHSMVAVDELINKFMHNIYSRSCSKKVVGWYDHELNCNRCFKKDEVDENCIWCLFINIVDKEKFNNDYVPVGNWLTELHDIENKADTGFYNNLRELFINRFKNEFVLLCRYHNAKLISRDLNSDDKFSYIKEAVKSYIEKYDSTCSSELMKSLVGKIV